MMIKKYLLVIGAIAIVACAPEKKSEIADTLINTEWFYFDDVENADKSRVSDEMKLKFYVVDFRITNRHIVTSSDGKKDITYDTIDGSSYTYTKPNGRLIFEREIYNPCTFIAGPGTLKVQFTNNTLEFVKN